jgi:hypothetical protein
MQRRMLTVTARLATNIMVFSYVKFDGQNVTRMQGTTASLLGNWL